MICPVRGEIVKPYVVLVIVLAVAIWVMMDKLAEQPVRHRTARVSNTHEVPREGVGGMVTPVTPQRGVADELSNAKVWEVNQITAHFEDNEVTAESLFSPQTLFQGVIESIETNALSGARVTIDATGFRGSLMCDVEAEDVSGLASLHRGQTAVFSGSGARKFMGLVIFDHCRLVNPAS